MDYPNTKQASSSGWDGLFFLISVNKFTLGLLSDCQGPSSKSRLDANDSEVRVSKSDVLLTLPDGLFTLEF